MRRLFCFGLGYSASALARQLCAEGWHVAGTARTQKKADALAASGFGAFIFDGVTAGADVFAALSGSTHVLISVPPDEHGDPVLRHFADDLAVAPTLEWIGYLSTIGVYGDRQGGWVDEATPPDRTSPRAGRRIAAEEAWFDFGERTGIRITIFRLAGIYGPGRSAIEKLREGSAQRIVKLGQVFNRIHVDDIAAALRASIAGRGSHAIYNATDDEPSPPQDVIAYAAQLLHMPPPPEVAFEAAKLSPAVAGFYGENRRVSNARLRGDLAVELKFPSYREGLRAIVTALGITARLG